MPRGVTSLKCSKASVGRISSSVMRRMESPHTAEGLSGRSPDNRLRLEYASTLFRPTYADRDRRLGRLTGDITTQRFDAFGNPAPQTSPISIYSDCLATTDSAQPLRSARARPRPQEQLLSVK